MSESVIYSSFNERVQGIDYMLMVSTELKPRVRHVLLNSYAFDYILCKLSSQSLSCSGSRKAANLACRRRYLKLKLPKMKLDLYLYLIK